MGTNNVPGKVNIEQVPHSFWFCQLLLLVPTSLLLLLTPGELRQGVRVQSRGLDHGAGREGNLQDPQVSHSASISIALPPEAYFHLKSSFAASLIVLSHEKGIISAYKMD